MSWTDSDETKDWLGLTWENGETKELCPYDFADGCYTGTSTHDVGYYKITYSYSDCIEGWAYNENADQIGLKGRSFYEKNLNYDEIMNDYQSETLRVKYGGASLHLDRVITYQDYENGHTDTSDLDTHSPTWEELVVGRPISDAAFGQLTTTNGVHIEWERGSGW